MQEVKIESRENLDLELFNVSGEFEDIEIAINDISGRAEMVISARRC